MGIGFAGRKKAWFTRRKLRCIRKKVATHLRLYCSIGREAVGYVTGFTKGRRGRLVDRFS